MSIMDLDKFREQSDDPELEQAFAALDQEPTSAIIERMKRMNRLERRKRIIRRVMVRTPPAIVVGLAAFKFLVEESREVPSQTVAFIIELAVVFALNLVEKAREKYEQPKMWLAHKEFLRDEQRRLKKIVLLDQWNSVLVSLAIICLALYAAPLLLAGLRIACWIVTGAAVLALQIYERRKISQLKREREIVAAELDELETEDLAGTDL
jgi:hypothetical protein